MADFETKTTDGKRASLNTAIVDSMTLTQFKKAFAHLADPEADYKAMAGKKADKS